MQQLAAEFQRMCAMAPGERLAYVQAARRLELGHGRGPPDALQVPARKVEHRNSAANRGVRWRILQSDQLLRAARAEIGWQLKEISHGITEPRIGYHGGAQHPYQT